jgi:hypothetical protein
MFWRIKLSLEEFDLALSTGPTSSTRSIDMNPCLHGSLKEVLLLVYQNFSFTGAESYIMLRHELVKL